MSNIKISERLKKVARCVNEGSKVADIGCDHAYIAIYLIKNNIATKVVAMDINKGPLQKAKKNIEEYGCLTQIDTRLSDGAKKLEVGEVDTILISGMGGRLISKILAESIDVVRECSQLVLQPQSEIYLVRKFLDKIGFSIIYEDMLIEDGKYYVIINAKNKLNLENLDKDKDILELKNALQNIDVNIDELDKNSDITVDEKYGKYLLETKNDILHEFLLKEITKINDITVELSSKMGDDERLKNRINELNKEKELISEALRYYE